MNVTLAIPNYNGGSDLKNVLNQAVRLKVARIFVMDDASTDDSVRIAESFGSQVNVIRGCKNLGAAGNRNRIIPHLKGGAVLFLDADMEIQAFSRAKLKRAFLNPRVGVVGGNILNRESQPMAWNFGYLMHPARDAVGTALSDAWQDGWIAPSAKPAARKQAARSTKNIERTLDPLKPRTVDWVSEACFAIRASLFAKLGGFDPKMRASETHDLAHRVKERRAVTRYAPFMTVRHLERKVRSKKKSEIEAIYYYYRKHWGMSRTVFEKLYGQSLPTGFLD